MIRRLLFPWVRFLFLVLCCIGLSGCEIFSLPGQIIGGIFGLLGQVLQVANNMPKPPPGVFF
jgi:hypothetical protein